MNQFKFNILAVCATLLLLAACKKEEAKKEIIPDGRVVFDMPASIDVVEKTLDIKQISLLTMEMKATLSGSASSDEHYITFAPDTNKIANYRQKYDRNAILLPAQNYLYYKSKVSIPAGSSYSDVGVLNLSGQTSLKARSTYVLPLAVMYVDGQLQDPTTRSVVYYVFKTGEALYADHTGYVVQATASSTAGVNTAARAVDANNTTTFWASGLNPETLPQWLSIDYGRAFTFSGFDIFYPTSVNYALTGGDPTSARVEVSADGTTWSDQGIYPINLRNTDRKQTINFPTSVTARHMRVTILTAEPYVSGTVSHQVTLVSGIMIRN